VTDRVQLPEYRCHKRVQAVRVKSIRYHADGGATFGYEVDNQAEHAELDVTGEFILRHRPYLPGYFVRYEDGYESWSPADAFEAGYTRIGEKPTSHHVFSFFTETGKQFEVLTDKFWEPEERRYIDAHEVLSFHRDFDWGALQRLRKVSP
jgi:hypothetical protein